LGRVLDRHQEVCDLGVTLNSSLNFRLHVDHTVNKAYKMLGFIFRQFRGCSHVLSLMSLFICLVRTLVPELHYDD